MQPRIYDKVGHTLIHTFTCNKLSVRAQGQLQYQLWQHNDYHTFSLALSANESSGGFSAELIAIEQILATLTQLHQDAKPFHAVALKGLFMGKSVNNASFLGAVLVDQQVIQPHPQTVRLLEVKADYQHWATQLSQYIKKGKAELAEGESTNSQKPLSKKTAKSKGNVDMEDDHADHQE